jgi:hypothetical protein
MADVKNVGDGQSELALRESVLYPWLFDEMLVELCGDNLDPLRTSQFITCVYRLSESYITKHKIAKNFWQAVGSIAFYIVWKSMGIGFLCDPFRSGDITIEEVNEWTTSQYKISYLHEIKNGMLADEGPEGPCKTEIAAIRAKK